MRIWARVEDGGGVWGLGYIMGLVCVRIRRFFTSIPTVQGKKQNKTKDRIVIFLS